MPSSFYLYKLWRYDLPDGNIATDGKKPAQRLYHPPPAGPARRPLSYLRLKKNMIQSARNRILKM
jgi:hypothetical protein